MEHHSYYSFSLIDFNWVTCEDNSFQNYLELITFMYFSLCHNLSTAEIKIIFPKENWLLWERTEKIETS